MDANVGIPSRPYKSQQDLISYFKTLAVLNTLFQRGRSHDLLGGDGNLS